jgi:hypothetical protein
MVRLWAYRVLLGFGALVSIGLMFPAFNGSVLASGNGCTTDVCNGGFGLCGYNQGANACACTTNGLPHFTCACSTGEYPPCAPPH